MEMKGITDSYSVQQASSTAYADKKSNDPKSVNKQGSDANWSNEGATYEKGSNTKSATYSINKMSKEERAALVNQLKADSEQRQSQFLDIVRKTISGQADAFGKANNNSIWRTLASGNFTVDAATKAQAQKDIGEDG